MIYWIAVLIAWVVFHIPYRIRTIGRENLPKDRGYVLCPNHLSAIDPVFVVLARFWGKKMWVMAKEELFRNPVIAWFFGHVGVFPVARGRGDRSVLDSAIAHASSAVGLPSSSLHRLAMTAATGGNSEESQWSANALRITCNG